MEYYSLYCTAVHKLYLLRLAAIHQHVGYIGHPCKMVCSVVSYIVSTTAVLQAEQHLKGFIFFYLSNSLTKMIVVVVTCRSLHGMQYFLSTAFCDLKLLTFF